MTTRHRKSFFLSMQVPAPPVVFLFRDHVEIAQCPGPLFPEQTRTLQQQQHTTDTATPVTQALQTPALSLTYAVVKTTLSVL